jgi:hypothetical protein
LTCGNNDLHAAGRGSGGRSAQRAGRWPHGPSGGASPWIETVKKRDVKSSTSRTRLAIRSRPTTNSRRLGSLHPGQIVDIKCWARGQSVRGVRTWYRLGISTPEWVSGRYIRIVKGRVHHC